MKNKKINNTRTNKETKAFWAQCQKNYDEVLTWPKWMRCIVITAETASTGQFIGKDIKESKR